MVNRADALALIRDQDANEIWQQAPQFSAALRTFRQVNMGKKKSTYPVIGTLPNAAFVTGEDVDATDNKKPVTSADWDNREIEAEEIAGIVIIPENVLDDAGPEFNLWAEIRPRIAEAVGVTLDAAVFFGTGAPASWPDGLVPQAVAAGNVYVEGTSGVDLAEDLNQTIGLVETDGYDATVAYSRRGVRSRFRGLRDENRQPIIQPPTAGAAVPTLYGADWFWVGNGSWDLDEATVLVGDPSYAILGIRQDLTFKFLDQASVTVSIGGTPTLISLAERDLLGLRFKMRVGFQTAEVATRDGGEDAFPFAVLQPAS
jgi:HK97 family phage major capsid protein